MPKRYTRWSKRVERNILSCWYRANEYDLADGREWYQIAHNKAEAIALRHGVPVQATIGAIAALSPGCQWERNLEHAELLIGAWKAKQPVPIVGIYGSRNRRKALRILNGKDPLSVLPVTGPKVRAFYQCIHDPAGSTAIVIDRHSKCLALSACAIKRNAASNEALAGVTLGEYRYFEWHYRKLAERLKVQPAVLQATCWLVWKRVHGNLAQEELTILRKGERERT